MLVCEWGRKWCYHGIGFLHLFEKWGEDVRYTMSSQISAGRRAALGILSRKIKGILDLKKKKKTHLILISVGWCHCICHLRVKISFDSGWWLGCGAGVGCNSHLKMLKMNFSGSSSLKLVSTRILELQGPWWASHFVTCTLWWCTSLPSSVCPGVCPGRGGSARPYKPAGAWSGH